MSELHNFFINPEDIKDNFAIIKGTDFHHIKNVLRGKVGTRIYATTISGKYEAEITEVSGNYVKIKLLDLIAPSIDSLDLLEIKIILPVKLNCAG